MNPFCNEFFRVQVIYFWKRCTRYRVVNVQLEYWVVQFYITISTINQLITQIIKFVQNVQKFHDKLFINFRIIATQLYSKLVKNLILTDPHRIKCTAESIPVKFHVPVGCQLITIYIPQYEYDELLQNSERIQTMCANQENANVAVNGTTAVVNGINAYPPIQFKKKIMKRDKSIVFTNIPEEHTEHAEAASTASSSDNKIDPDKSNNKLKNNENPLNFTPQPATVRPNHLPLRFKNITSKDIPESGFSSSITFDEQDSFPQFIGRTSVCSTPMTENKVLHGNILPICGNPFNEKNAIPKNNSSKSIIANEPPPIVNNQKEPKNINVNQEKSNGKFFDMSDRFLSNTATNPFAQQVRRNSLVDITEAFRKFSKHLSLRPISTGFANFMDECDYIADGKVYGKTLNDGAQDDLTIDYDADVIDDVVSNNRYRTIADPTYPVFNSFGKPISRFLFDEIANQQNENEINAKNLNINFNAFDEQPQTIRNDLKSADNEMKMENAIKSLEKSLEKSPMPPINNNINRKSLSLPLKSLTSNGDAKNNINSAIVPTDAANTKNIFDKPEERRKLTGIQLTPLITKLSILAMSEDRSNSFSTWDTTPSGIELTTPLDSVKLFRRRSSIKGDETDQVRGSIENKNSSECSNDEGDLKKVELFICGQNNMTLLLVMKENFGQKHEHIQAMVKFLISILNFF